jgi:AraC-like DNA-binding protein
MAIRSPTIPARYVAAVIGYAESLGLDRREILRAAGIDPTRLDNPDAALAIAEFDSIAGNISLRTGRQDLGFEVGRRLTWEMHGALGRALQRCTDLDQALVMHSRCYSLIMPAYVVTYSREPERATVTFRPVVGMTHEALCTLNEIHAVSFHILTSAAVKGRLPPYDIHLPMDRPPHASRYREMAPARVHFARLPMPELRIVCGPEMTGLPLLLADPHFVTREGVRLERSLSNIMGEDSWSDWVTLLLREAEDCQPTLPQIAAIVGIGPQALARRLAREGQSFRGLSSMVRHERACQLLLDSSTPVAQISNRLGYSSVANFSTAFRREAGVSPRQFRAAAPG